MDKSELERRLEAAEKQMLGLQDEIKNLKERLNEIQEDEIPEYPTFEYGEKYYPYCHYSGNAHGSTWEGETQIMDYNCFHSAEYHQLFDAKIREIAMLLHCKWYCDRNAKIDFYDSKTKWYLYKHHYANGNFGGWKVYTTTYEETATIYFSTEEAAKKACEWMNTHAKRGDSNDEN